uniref:Ribosomal_L16 domain-containing protein n=1 Tax=Meloidogyne hapla TaxID=6305 RepID=A0A1I8BJF0_MELHA
MNKINRICVIPLFTNYGCLHQIRNSYNYPVTFEKVVFPPDGKFQLPTMPPEPVYDEALGEVKKKLNKRMIEARGYEPIHTEDHVNKMLKKDQFAIWRVDAPWLPRTQRLKGTKRGGGKGPIHHFETPVRGGRIVLEVGGYILEAEARAQLMPCLQRFPFPVEFVSEELLQRRREVDVKIKDQNENKFDWDTVIKYNMQVIEIVALTLLAMISSIEDHCKYKRRLELNFRLTFPFSVLHMILFNTFVICSTLYMVIGTYLFDLSGRRRSCKLGEISFQTKAFCCVGQFVSLVFALYFFYRHNRYCESGMYTLFALSEYSLILFNGLFHTTIYYEFQSRVLSLVTAALKANYYLLPMHDYIEKRGT